MTPVLAPTTHTFLEATTKGPRNGPKRSRGASDFKPIPAERGPVPHAACNYTKWPEVKLHDRDRLVGIVAQADIALRENEKKTGELVEAISKPSEGERR